jgi:F-type H+-transporting ATPase subunit alpha
VIKAGAFERALRDHIAQKHKGLTEAIENDRDLSSDNEAKLRSAIEEFKKTGAY